MMYNEDQMSFEPDQNKAKSSLAGVLDNHQIQQENDMNIKQADEEEEAPDHTNMMIDTNANSKENMFEMPSDQMEDSNEQTKQNIE